MRYRGIQNGSPTIPNVMTPFAILIALFLMVAPFTSEAADAIYSEVAILPPSPGPHPDLEDLLHRFWHDYFGADGSLGFSLAQVRVGRVDLNDDDQAELILMIDHPGWKADAGKPFVIATWKDESWMAIGWGWGDEDGIWSLVETQGGWHSLDTGSAFMRWNGHEYERIIK